MNRIVFTSERLEAVKSSNEDIDFIMKLENLEENYGLILGNTKEEHREYLNNTSYLVLIILDKATKKRLGYILNKIDSKTKVLELRRFALEEKGSGYGREILGAFIDYSFKELDINRIWLDVYEYNKNAIRLYASMGMQIDAVLRGSFKLDGKYRDQVIFSLLKDEYI